LRHLALFKNEEIQAKRVLLLLKNTTFFSPKFVATLYGAKPLGSIFPTAFAHFMSVSHFGNLGKHYYYYIFYCDLELMVSVFSLDGKMQESGLSAIIPSIGISAI